MNPASVVIILPSFIQPSTALIKLYIFRLPCDVLGHTISCKSDRRTDVLPALPNVDRMFTHPFHTEQPLPGISNPHSWNELPEKQHVKHSLMAFVGADTQETKHKSLGHVLPVIIYGLIMRQVSKTDKFFSCQELDFPI